MQSFPGLLTPNQNNFLADRGISLSYSLYAGISNMSPRVLASGSKPWGVGGGGKKKNAS